MARPDLRNGSSALMESDPGRQGAVEEAGEKLEPSASLLGRGGNSVPGVGT